jgi:hypothetical protein
MDKRVEEFIKENNFVMLCSSPASIELCLWVCPFGETWTYKDILEGAKNS